MMEETKQQIREGDSKNNVKLLELISKFAVIFGGLCYLLGLFVVNISFLSYDFFTLNFLRTGYILAGACSLIVLVISMSPFTRLLVYTRKHLTKRAWHICHHSLPFLLTVLLSGWRYSLLQTFPQVPAIVLDISCMLCMVEVSTYNLVCLSEALTQKPKGLSPWASPGGGVEVIRLLISLGLYIWIFSSLIYPIIPRLVGGGELQSLILIPKQEAFSVLPLAGIQLLPADSLTSRQRFSMPIQLLYSGDDEYYFLVGSGGAQHSVSIRRDLIQSIVYSDAFTPNMKEIISKSTATIKK
jgi:hypothetical protein